MEKVPEAGFPIEGLWISGLQRRLTLKNLTFPFKVISSMWKARRILSRFAPDVVVGVGGFASGPMLRSASSRKIPTLIQEQNSYAGLTNRLLARRVDKICVAYPDMEKYFPAAKIIITGNPVRKDIADLQRKHDQAVRHFQLNPKKPILLAVGGSLGARTINESMMKGMPQLAETDVQVIWQVGKIYYEEMKERMASVPSENIRMIEFLREMDLAYAAADVVVSRAGALAISELCIAGKPAILVPSPNVAEDHQTKNAMALVNRQAALMVTDTEAPANLVKEAVRLIFNESLQHALSKNIKLLGKPEAADTIAKEVLALIK